MVKKLKGDKKRRYILLNPSFVKDPIEITERQAIKQIKSHMDSGRYILGDEIIIVVQHLSFILSIQKIEGRTIEFKHIQRIKK